MSLEELVRQPGGARPAGAEADVRGTKRGLAGSVSGSRRCYVGNLSYKTSWQDLKDHFRQVGGVVHAKVLEEAGSSKGCGIVEFEKPEEAAKAIEQLHDSELGGRLLIVREDREDRELKDGGGKAGGKGAWSKAASASDSGSKRVRMGSSFDSTDAAGGEVQSKRCYVGNLSYRTSWQDLKDHFRQIGKVVYTNVMEEFPGRSKGCGIVEFETAKEAAQAIKTLHDSELDGRQIFVREDREDRELKQGGGRAGAGRDGGGRGGGGASESKRCYVGNLSYKTSWQDLKDHFRSAGKVVYSNVMTEQGTGRSKGCGIVEFETAREAARAIETLHDSELDGRPIFVREDREDRDLK